MTFSESRQKELQNEIRGVNDKIDVSDYLYGIISNPAINRELMRLLENGEEALANGQWETSYKHSIDVAEIAEDYCDSHEWAIDEKNIFVTAALLHDLGKADPEIVELVTVNSRFTDSQRDEMKSHPEKSYQACQKIADSIHNVFNRIAEMMPDSKAADEMREIIAEIALRHHAYGEGDVYPGKEFFHINSDPEKEKMVERMAKILSVIDVFDALRSYRPYRSPASKEEAEAILKNKFPEKAEQEVIDFLIDNLTGEWEKDPNPRN